MRNFAESPVILRETNPKLRLLMDLEDFLKQIKVRDGIGTWLLFLSMLLIYLSLSYGPEGWQSRFLLDDHIRNGEWWRLLTPSLLHKDAMHLFGSAFWIVFLGYQLEYYFGTLRFFIVIVLLSLFSNCCEYYLHGGSFLGFSAVFIGIGTFLWRRETSFREKYFFPPFEKLMLFATNLVLCLTAIAEMYEILPWFTTRINSLVEMLAGPPCMLMSHIAHISAGIFGWFLGGFTLFQYRDCHRPLSPTD